MSPLPAILYMSPGLLEEALVGAFLARDLSLHTHAHLVCTHRHIDKSHRCLTHTHLKRNKCERSDVGSGFDHEECQPRVVVWHLGLSVSLSAMGNCGPGELRPEGDVMGQDVFPVVRFSHACGHAQRPVEEILSTPWPLHLVGVRSSVPHQPHTHTNTFYPNICSFTMKQYGISYSVSPVNRRS